MSTLADSFLVNSPKKVLERAEIYTKSDSFLTQHSKTSINCHMQSASQQ